MRIWPRIAELLTDRPRRLTPRRLGYLEAVNAPCVVGGEETSVTLGVERAVLFGPDRVARLMVRGNPYLAAVAAWRWRVRDLAAGVEEVTDYVRSELWTPPRFVPDGATVADASKIAFPLSLRIAVMGVRAGFGSASRTARDSVWDRPVAEIIAFAVCGQEHDGTAEFQTYEEERFAHGEGS